MEYLLILIGLLIGYWARDVQDKLKELTSSMKAAKKYEKAGVVRPYVNKLAPPQAVDLSTKSGVIRQKGPIQYENEQRAEREAKIAGR